MVITRVGGRFYIYGRYDFMISSIATMLSPDRTRIDAPIETSKEQEVNNLHIIS
jgi:hypothetical protein